MPPIALTDEGLSPIGLSEKTIDFGAQNPPLSSPNRNFTFLELQILSKIALKMDNCGVSFQEFVGQRGELLALPAYCDNRSCENPLCKSHRGYKFMKTHLAQIDVLNKSMKHPRGWVMSGWVLPIENITKEFLSSMLTKLFRLMKQFALSEFSIHMELKPHADGTAYVHFHVVCGSIQKLRLVRALWGRQIKYENAISPDNLGGYVSKYASKVPAFPSETWRDCYTVLVYKLQMHRFSPRVEKCETVSYWTRIEVLVHEAERAFQRGRSRRKDGSCKDYIPFVDDNKPPPWSDVPRCVQVVFE